MIINEIILNLMRLQMNGRALFDVREGIIEEIKLHKLIGQGLNKMFFTNENLVKIVSSGEVNYYFKFFILL